MEKSGAIIIEGHVQGLANTRALGKEGIPVIVIDKSDCVASSSKYCTAFYNCPDFKSKEFINFLIDLAKEKKLHGWVLLPSNDHAVFNISQNLQLIKRFYKTTIPDNSILNKIYNKKNLLDIAQNLNVPIPKTYYIESLDQIEHMNMPFPLLTKGKQGLDFYKKLGKKAFLANDKNQLYNQLKEINSSFLLKNTFTQELIPLSSKNKTLSLAAFSVEGEIKVFWMGIKLREHPIRFGTATFTESVNENNCLRSAKALLKELNYTGVCEVEFLRDPRDNQFKLIEINARTWLWVGHAIANGINFPLIIYNFLNNIKTEYHSDYQIGLKWRNPFSDFIFNIIGIIKGYYSISSIRMQNKGNVINALWDINDIKPWFKYACLMFNFAKNR